jgi:hypothetical protein
MFHIKKLFIRLKFRPRYRTKLNVQKLATKPHLEVVGLVPLLASAVEVEHPVEVGLPD